MIGGAAPTCAADVAGIWALRAQGSTLMLLEVSRSRKGWTGSWTQPSSYDTNGEYFNDIKANTITRRSREAHKIEDGVELVFDNPWPGGRRIISRSMRTARATPACSGQPSIQPDMN